MPKHLRTQKLRRAVVAKKRAISLVAVRSNDYETFTLPDVKIQRQTVLQNFHMSLFNRYVIVIITLLRAVFKKNLKGLDFLIPP